VREIESLRSKSTQRLMKGDVAGAKMTTPVSFSASAAFSAFRIPSIC